MNTRSNPSSCQGRFLKSTLFAKITSWSGSKYLTACNHYKVNRTAVIDDILELVPWE